MKTLFESARQAVEESTAILIQETRREWQAQDKIASGKAFRKIIGKTGAGSDLVFGQVYVMKYMIYQDKGVNPSRIKIGKAMIDGLTKWVRLKLRNVPASKRRSVAWAIAKKMQKEGMPTRNARRYSPSGRVLDWSKHALDSAQPMIDVVINRRVGHGIDAAITNIIKS